TVQGGRIARNRAGGRDGGLEVAIILRPAKGNPLAGLGFEELVNGRVCLAVSCKHPFARRQPVSFADAVREPFIGLVREKYPRYEEYLAAGFAGGNEKPRIVEEHDGWPGGVSSVAGGSGGARSWGVC